MPYQLVGSRTVKSQLTLVSAHGGILVFLQALPETVELVCYCPVCLGNVILEGRGPAVINQGGDDQEFNQ